jgi:ABC-2 type transport system permease protein
VDVAAQSSGPSAAPAVLAALRSAVLAPAPGRRATALSASRTFGWRALLRIRHSPDELSSALIMPIVFTLWITYLLGGAIAGTPGHYLQFFLPGVVLLSVALSTTYTGVNLNADIARGTFDRFRTLPVWRPSVIVGAMCGDVLRYAAVSIIPILLGLVLGYRPGGGFTGVLLALLYLQLFAFSLAWVWALLGVSVNSSTTVQDVSWMIQLLLSLASNIYVAQATLPGWLRLIVNANPLTYGTTTVRGLMGGTLTSHQLNAGLLTCGILLAVFASLTIYRYLRRWR